jgi:hypothetical protein
MSREKSGGSDDELLRSVRELKEELNRISEEIVGVKQRLLTLERRNRMPPSQSRGPSPQIYRERDNLLGAYQPERLTPALRETYDLVAELTKNPGKWISLKEIISSGSRSASTMSSYVKTLSREGYFKRKAKLEKKPKGRTVREYTYRPNE